MNEMLNRNGSVGQVTFYQHHNLVMTLSLKKV